MLSVIYESLVFTSDLLISLACQALDTTRLIGGGQACLCASDFVGERCEALKNPCAAAQPPCDDNALCTFDPARLAAGGNVILLHAALLYMDHP